MEVKAPSLTAGGVLALAALVAGGVAAWKLYKLAQNSGAADAIASAGRAWTWVSTPQDIAETNKPEGNLMNVPPPEEVSDDAAEARWLIDRTNYWTAGKWFTTGALIRAAMMDVGSGTPPPAGTALARAFGLSSAYIDFGNGTDW